MSEDLKQFIAWHESVIAQYPLEIQIELRYARTKFVSNWDKYK